MKLSGCQRILLRQQLLSAIEKTGRTLCTKCTESVPAVPAVPAVPTVPAEEIIKAQRRTLLNKLRHG